ncbi:LAME_0F17194g1_1 [Lachancea meyersii CBS 8951]|uniref:Ribosome assembly protein 1 n=1 Tax=Lachancea meyersii CBS 8951 TaxID=1266667 RepID=A0A1G4JZR1_9SACH|nr:LAME_0F17194g1_1 [Lachancea meyersii CBS 8951]
MSRVGPETSKRLQKDPSCIRNICILAHVDHGKTSLSDSLLASNGIISQKLAGKVRFLDSRPDEQLRGITMESSAISLYFRILRKQEGQEDPLVNEHLINLIDSPGHIDFSSEVSTASRLCDGAVVLVDVVEGVCSQTVTVLRQCWVEKLKPVLVLNKMDRLIMELQLTPQEAFLHLNKIIEQVNSIIGSFYNGQRILDDLSWREQLENNNTAEFVEKDDSDIYFRPENNNVIFASAIDGWGFNIGQLAKFYEQKLGAKRENLQKVLWGEYYMDPKTKKFINSKGLKGRTLKPLFVTLILDNIWKIYNNVLIDRDSEVLEKITTALNIKVPPRDLRSKDLKNLLRTVMGQWLPVSVSVLLTVIEKLPSPLEAQGDKMERIIGTAPGHEMIDTNLYTAMESCDKDGSVCAFVSKMISVPKEELPLTNGTPFSPDALMQRSREAREKALKAAKAAELAENLSRSKDPEGEQSNMYARAQETTATPNLDEQASHETSRPSVNDEFQIVTQPAPELDLALDLGIEYENEFEGQSDEDNEFQPEFIPAGIEANDPLNSLFEYEEEDPFETDASEREAEDDDDVFEESDEVMIGIARLYSGTLRVGQKIAVLGPKYDPHNPTEHIEEVEVTDLFIFMGKDLVPLTECPPGNIVGIGGLAGKILKNGTIVEPSVEGANLAGVNLHVTPIVRVALEPTNPTQMNKLARGLRLLNQADPCVQTYVEDTGEHILCAAGELHLERCLKDLTERFAGISITSSEPAIPYKESFLSTTDMNPPKDAELGRGTVQTYLDQYALKIRTIPLPNEITEFLLANEKEIKAISERKEQSKKTEEFRASLDKLFSEAAIKDKVWSRCSLDVSAFGGRRVGPNVLISNCVGLNNSRKGPNGTIFEYGSSIINGFELAVNQGPLCQEPVQGMCVFIEDVHEMSNDEIESLALQNHQVGLPNLAGRLITTTRDSIHAAFLDWSPRIMWAMYQCDIQASVEVLGKVYAVVQQRRGRIVSEEMKDGIPLFQIEAKIPVVEAFGFSEDIRKKTSGAAQPQLVFAGFEAIDLDPFWVPTTEEELEDLGDTADKENLAGKHMNMIRRRKGLFVNEKLVQNAEKQRTLKRN